MFFWYWFWYPIIIVFAALVSAPLLFAELGHFRKFHRIIFSILVLVAILESWCFYLGYYGQPNLVYYNAVFVYILPVVYIYFFQEVFKQEGVKIRLYFLAGLFLLFGLIKTLFLTPFHVFHNDLYIMGSFIIIGCCLYFFYNLVSKNQFLDIDLIRFPIFWVVTFLLFFYSSAMLNFATIRFVNKNNYELMKNFSIIINSLGALMYLVFASSFYLPLIKKKNNGIT